MTDYPQQCNYFLELDYYIVDEPTGKVTVVNVPFYEGKTFKGVVEFIFESALD